MEGTNNVYVKYEILERLSRDLHNPNRDKNCATKVFWSVGFKQDTNVILSFIKARKEFDLLLAGNILKADKFEPEYHSTKALLPYNMILNGLVVVCESTMDEKMLLLTATRLSKELKKFKNHDMPNPCYVTIIRKLPPEHVFYSQKDVMAFKLIDADIKPCQVIVDVNNQELYGVVKDYFGCFTNFLVPSDQKKYEYSLTLRETGLKIGEKDEKFDEKEAKQLLTTLQASFTPYHENEEFLSKLPLQEVLVSLKPNPNIPISDDIKMKIDANKYQIMAYYKYDCDLKSELKALIEHIKCVVKFLEEAQKNEIYMGLDIGYLTFIHRAHGPGFVAIIPIQEDDHPDCISYVQTKWAMPSKDIYRAEDTVAGVEKRLQLNKTNKLRNIHLDMAPSSIFGGWKFLVKGDYDYYHYGHDEIRDQGWGHTYRALQTVLSWYKNDGYLDFSPSVRELQLALVKAGEKTSDFEGSSDTIGAYEVGVVLKRLVDVDSKVLYIGNGKLVPEQALQLKEHFREEGSPVLIGGGSRAFVLLGIDYNELKDEVRFLILNPHYQGNENQREIYDNDWISWKDSAFFLKDAFYNFCLPKAKAIYTGYGSAHSNNW
jgi:hypothetical protein